MKLVRAAWDGGVRYVDTAPFYGVGAAERGVGDALRDKPRDEWVLSTKVGRLLRPQQQCRRRAPTVGWRRCRSKWSTTIPTTASCARWRTAISASDWRRSTSCSCTTSASTSMATETNAAHMKVLRESGYRALDELRRSGAVSAIGLGVNEKEVLIEVLKFGDWDVFLLAGRYTLLEQGPLDDLLPMCSARGTSIVVGGPLNSGILAGRDTWNYAAAPPEIVARVKAIEAMCDAHDVPLPAAALQFPLAHPAVAAIIPGPRAAAEFEANLALLRQPIPAALWADLREQGLLHPEAPTPS